MSKIEKYIILFIVISFFVCIGGFSYSSSHRNHNTTECVDTLLYNDYKITKDGRHVGDVNVCYKLNCSYSLDEDILSECEHIADSIFGEYYNSSKFKNAPQMIAYTPNICDSIQSGIDRFHVTIKIICIKLIYDY